MPTIVTETIVETDLARCFDLARDLDLHLRSMAHTGERAVAGRTSGLIELDEEVTWEARHFGVLHRHRSRITAFDRPRHFRDSMVQGRFASFEHDHSFTETAPGRALMRDVLVFRSPLGPLGAFVDQPLLASYLRRLLEQRGRVIQEAARSQSGDAR